MTIKSTHYWFFLSIGLLLCTGNGTTWAQAAADKEAADALFNEGKQLINKGDNAGACEKFEASLARVTQLGTQIALATCYEKLGKSASAWSAFRVAAGAASKSHDKRQQFAEHHAMMLEAQLSKIVIAVEATHRVDGMELKWDGAAVTLVDLSSPVPVDPGEHTVEVSAPGRIAWSTKVSIPSTPGVIAIAVPMLEKVPTPPIPRSNRRIIAYSVGGVGIASFITSLIFGGVARSKWNSAQLHCNGNHRVCDQTGVDLAHRAHSLGNVSTGTFILGAVAVTAGAIFLLTAPSAGSENVPTPNPITIRLFPDIEPGQVGVTLQGGF